MLPTANEASPPSMLIGLVTVALFKAPSSSKRPPLWLLAVVIVKPAVSLSRLVNTPSKMLSVVIVPLLR